MMSTYLVLKNIFGNHPLPFHIFNFVLHIINAFLMFVLLRHLKCSNGLATLLAALFATHPLVIEAVVWIGGVQDLYSLFFPLVLYILLLRWQQLRAIHWLAIAMTTFAAFMAKETNILHGVPAIFLLLVDKPVENGKGRFNRLVKFVTIHLVAMASYLTIRKIFIDFTELPQGVEPIDVIVSFSKAVLVFTKLFIMPLPLKFHRPLTVEDLSVATMVLVAALVIGALIWALYQLIKKQNCHHAFAFALIIYPLMLAGIASASTAILAERYFYLPLAGVFLFIGASRLAIFCAYLHEGLAE
jgi:hypothetical protein